MELVAVKDLREGMELAQDIYLEGDPSTAYLRRGFVLTDKAIQRLHAQNVQKIYVEGRTASSPQIFTPLYHKTLPKVPSSAPASAAFSTNTFRRTPFAPGTVFQTAHAKTLAPVPTVEPALQEEALATLQTTFEEILISDTGVYRSASVESILQPMDHVVQKLVNRVIFSRQALVNISDLKTYDDYTYHHSLSVAVLSIAIGRQLGFSANQLSKLGMAAMMHDIGKIAIPQSIIQKPSKLDNEEFDIIKGHSKAGAQYLIESSVGNEKLWRAVLCHHEKMDGTGYPNGIKSQQIPVWSRIISVADVYDALTSARPYRTPMQPADALEYVMGGVNTAFDYDVVQALIRKVDLYPVGSCIELSNGELALVLDGNVPGRPIVEILGSNNIVDMFTDREYLSVVITQTLPTNHVVIQKK